MIANMHIFVFSVMVGLTVALPALQQYHQQSQYQQQQQAQAYSPYPKEPPIPIIESKSDVSYDGTYAYKYQTGNGIAAEEKGYVKNAGYADNEIQTAQGYYTYTGPDGVQYTITYTADENGFVPQGDHLPKAPEIPAEIAKALQSLPKDDTQYDDNGNPIKKSAQYGR